MLEQAIFYVLWHCGLRLSEAEELRVDDFDLSARRLSVRAGKGQKDRPVYLTEVAVNVFREYMAVRGDGSGNNFFLYHNAPLAKSFISSYFLTLSKKTGVKVYSHKLRHTAATQLLNAGCRITSIQKILGHKNIRTTMIYARVYDQTVAEDFYAAMARVEERLNIIPERQEEAPEEEKQDEIIKVPMVKLMNWMELLSRPELGCKERLEIAESLRQALGAPAFSSAPPG